MITAIEINLVFIVETLSTAEKFFFSLQSFFLNQPSEKKWYPGKNDLIMHSHTECVYSL